MYSVVCYVKNNPLLWYRDGLLSFDSHTIWVAFIPKSNKTDLILVASCMSILCTVFLIVCVCARVCVCIYVCMRVCVYVLTVSHMYGLNVCSQYYTS